MLELDNCQTEEYHGMQKMRRFGDLSMTNNNSSIEKCGNNLKHQVNIFSSGNENEVIPDRSDINLDINHIVVLICLHVIKMYLMPEESNFLNHLSLPSVYPVSSINKDRQQLYCMNSEHHDIGSVRFTCRHNSYLGLLSQDILKLILFKTVGCC